MEFRIFHHKAAYLSSRTQGARLDAALDGAGVDGVAAAGGVGAPQAQQRRARPHALRSSDQGSGNIVCFAHMRCSHQIRAAETSFVSHTCAALKSGQR